MDYITSFKFSKKLAMLKCECFTHNHYYRLRNSRWRIRNGICGLRDGLYTDRVCIAYDFRDLLIKHSRSFFGRRHISKTKKLLFVLQNYQSKEHIEKCFWEESIFNKKERE